MKEKLKKLQETCEKKGIYFSYGNKSIEDAFSSMAAPLNKGKKILGGAYIGDESKYSKWAKEKKDCFFAIVVVPVDACMDAKPKQYDDMQKAILSAAKEVGIKRAEMGASYTWPSIVIFKDEAA